MSASIRVLDLPECGVLLVGGTSGVGLAAAHHFARSGVTRIALVGRNAERGAQARDALLGAHPQVQVEFIAADANVPDQAAGVVETAERRLGSVDVLLTSTVGSFNPCLLHEMPLADIVPCLMEQVLAPLLMSRAVLPGMRARKTGVIINIASDAGKVATPGESVIGAAMAAITMFSRTLAIEAKRDGIRVNTLTPSLIGGTPVYDRVTKDGFSAKLFESAARAAHLGLVMPDDMAALIVFLASPQAAKLTGQAISLNGGISAA